MKRKFFGVISILLVFLCAFAIAACGRDEVPPSEDDPIEEEVPRIAYEGTYKLHAVNYGGAQLELGQGLLGVLTEDLAVLEFKEDGTMTFVCKILILQFNVTGKWSVDEEDETKITGIVDGEDGTQAVISATCDGETVNITYQATFTMKKA